MDFSAPESTFPLMCQRYRHLKNDPNARGSNKSTNGSGKILTKATLKWKINKLWSWSLNAAELLFMCLRVANVVRWDEVEGFNKRIEIIRTSADTVNNKVIRQKQLNTGNLFAKPVRHYGYKYFTSLCLIPLFDDDEIFLYRFPLLDSRWLTLTTATNSRLNSWFASASDARVSLAETFANLFINIFDRRPKGERVEKQRNPNLPSR